MRRTILSLSAIFFVAIFLIAAGGAESTLDSNKAVVRQVYDLVFNQGKVDQIDQFVAADAIEHELPPGAKEPMLAKDNLKAMINDMKKAFPDLKVQVEDIVAEGDKVSTRIRMTGTQTGEFNGMPASGKSFSIEAFDMLRMANGKVVEHWGLSDDAAMMAQLGIAPPPAK